MNRNSKVRYWQASIAMTLFGALAACSGANADEAASVGTEGAETSGNAENVTGENSSELMSPVETAKGPRCNPYHVCCEPLPNNTCILCARDYRYCP